MLAIITEKFFLKFFKYFAPDDILTITAVHLKNCKTNTGSFAQKNENLAVAKYSFYKVSCLSKIDLLNLRHFQIS